MSNLGRLIDQVKKRKETIVLATGVFDLLHEEHESFLRDAKQKGDFLIVGIESDVRVRKLKGKERPINKEDVRRKKLLKLDCVDCAVVLSSDFDDEKKRKTFLKMIKPDVLAVSSHSPNIENKKKLMKEIGGKLVVVRKWNPKISSTKLIKSKQKRMCGEKK